MNDRPASQYQLVSALFLRLLGITYLIAFASISVQIEGLIGSQGIMPIADRLADFAQHTGPERYISAPTLFWFNASDAALTAVPLAGCLAAVLILFGWWQRAALVVAWCLYLSLFHAGQPFLNFQWDMLLLESGFLAMFLTPRSRVVVWLFRWLLFRLRFMSGLSKLVSGDPAWSGLTALNTYFEVQPLPNPVSWYMHQLPEWLLKTGTAATLAVELLVPFMMFLPRPWRIAAAWITILFQLLIIATSNHNWINFLTIFLCLFLFDDRALRRIVPGRIAAGLSTGSAGRLLPAATRRAGIAVLGGLIFAISLLKFHELATGSLSEGVAGHISRYSAIYNVANKYHVFPTMTTQRIELEILGSRDGVVWLPYHFRYKPDRLDARPQFIIPHQPRVDWQMWFVTLHPRHLDWFAALLEALLDNSPTAKALLANDPFPDEPPRMLRVQAWRYTYTDAATREATGNWWQREELGPFSPLPWLENRD